MQGFLLDLKIEIRRMKKKKICFLDFLSWEQRSTNLEELIISLEVELGDKEIQEYLCSLWLWMMD